MIQVPDEKVTNRAAIAQLRCEVGETLQGGHCELPGEVQFEGLLLCEWHARQSEARDRIDLLQGIISSLDLSLSNVLLWRDTDLVRLLRFWRTQAAQELHRAQESLRQTSIMLSRGRQ